MSKKQFLSVLALLLAGCCTQAPEPHGDDRSISDAHLRQEIDLALAPGAPASARDVLADHAAAVDAILLKNYMRPGSLPPSFETLAILEKTSEADPRGARNVVRAVIDVFDGALSDYDNASNPDAYLDKLTTSERRQTEGMIDLRKQADDLASKLTPTTEPGR